MWALAVIRPAGMKLPYRNTGQQAPYAAMAYQVVSRVFRKLVCRLWSE